MASTRVRVVTAAVLAVLLTPRLFAQTPAGRETSAESVARYSLTEQMPVDPEVALGTLPNGLRYYVRPNAKPARRAEIRLVVKAGSVLEDEDQLGLAHFVEHLQFEGTRNFPKQSLTEFLRTLGMSLGADANAATSYDDTQYTLRVPTDVPGAIERALLVLHDWAGAATFDPDAIERQRAIVLSEWRMNLGAGERTSDKILRVQLQGSRYPDRRPIGRPDAIEKASRETLMRFYRDWYRPDLMAVIVTGEIDRDAVVKMIINRFSMLANPSPSRARPAIDVPEQPGTRYAIVADREMTATAVQFSNLRPARNQGTVGGYRSIMADQLFAAMLGERFDELTQHDNAPFIRAAADRSLFRMPRTKDQAILQALVSNDGVARGLDALVIELRRVAIFGFTETELARAKQDRMAAYERVVAESPDRESESRADEYTRNFLQGEALPTIWHELAFHRRFVPGITLKEINELTADWFPENNRVVVVSAPEAAGVTLPDQAQLAAVLKTAETKKLEAYVDAGAGEKLMETPPAKGSIVKTTARPDGITEWTLSNGATVLLKPTTLRVDQVLFRAGALGGTSLASDADYVPARIADDVITAGGVGKFTALQLDKLLTGKSVGVTAYIGEIEQGLGGGSTPQDLETMFQLLHLRFTQPRADQAAFNALRSQARALLANRAASPEVVFNQTIEAALNRSHPRRQPETTATVEQWNLEKSLAFYKARFADASAFRFVFVGSFTVDAIKPLVETYVASLPSTHAKQTWRDVGITPPAGIVEKTVEMGIAPKSQVAIVFSGPFQYDDQHVLALRTMALILQSRLLDSIRQELGGTYSITATPTAEKFPKPQYTVRIEWTCDPARTQALVTRVFEEIENVKGTYISREWLGRIRDVLLREYQDNIQENSYILNLIASHDANGGSPEVAPIAKMTDLIGNLTGTQIIDAAKTYLRTSDYVRVTLMPEKKQ